MKALLATLLILFASSALAALTPEQQQAKERGLMLFNQYKIAEPELRIAAEAGDAEAQFYLNVTMIVTFFMFLHMFLLY